MNGLWFSSGEWDLCIDWRERILRFERMSQARGAGKSYREIAQAEGLSPRRVGDVLQNGVGLKGAPHSLVRYLVEEGVMNKPPEPARTVLL